MFKYFANIKKLFIMLNNSIFKKIKEKESRADHNKTLMCVLQHIIGLHLAKHINNYFVWT